jgi:UDP-N-acetyl-D-mannosaminuronic acid dehydrogenase
VQEEFLDINWNDVIGQMKENPVILDSKNRVPRSVTNKAVLIRI